MANLKFSVAIRNEQLAAFNTICSSSATFTLYSGTQPAGGGVVTTQLAQLVGSAAFGATPSGGTLTLNAFTADTNADATGTCTWFRVANKNGDFCIDGDCSSVAVGTGDLQLDDPGIVFNGTVSVSGPNIISAGNAA